MPDYPYSRDGEAGVVRGGRERRGARGSGPQQPESASSGDVGRCDRRTGRYPKSRMRLAAQRPLLPALQRMLLHTPLRSHRASARPVFGFHIRLPCVSAYMVRRAVSACMEDYVRGDAKLFGSVDAGDHTPGHGRAGLSLLQYPSIQSEATGRPSPEGGPADRVTRRYLSGSFEAGSLRPSGSCATTAMFFAVHIPLCMNTPRSLRPYLSVVL